MINSIANLLGTIVRWIYNMLGQNYGLSIIIFAVLTKILLFPINIKQAKSMEKMKKVSPLEQEIRKKYKGDKEKMATEMQKVYSEHKINPLGGCLPALIQIPIILAMFYIVKQPLTYIKQMTKEEITPYVQEILNTDKKISDGQLRSYEIQVANENKFINMNFLGVNFGDIPANSLNKKIEKRPSYYTLIVPILSLVLSIIQTKQNIKNSNMTEEQKEQQKTMNMMMPFLSAYISYIMPIALGVYWFVGNMCQIISQTLINNVVKDKRIMLDRGSIK